ncbi:hypothetical protein A3K73_02990 [Candidatus Pacearchaeota archaeon RBG_13_36_9]|nr:MAG: hypothetical protein A3K73_02990 [Candidatus Pacearchaeota archaeon RBG_13_36_9]
MPHAVTHILIVIILLELYRDYFVRNKRAFPLHYVLIGGLAGLLPDLDIAAYYFLSFFGYSIGEVHRTFSHNLFIPLISVILAVPFWKFKNRKLGERHLKLRNIFLIIAFGVFMHLALDSILAGFIMPFYPFSTYSLGLNIINLAPLAWHESILPSIDAAILVLWLIHIERRHKISGFL